MKRNKKFQKKQKREAKRFRMRQEYKEQKLIDNDLRKEAERRKEEYLKKVMSK